jgi:hypothetical protein
MKIAMDTVTRQNPAAVFLVVDRYLDAGEELPEILKNATAPDPEEIAGLSDKAFADVNHRLYPINTANNAALSAIDYIAYGDDNEMVHSRIKKACHDYGLDEFYQSVEDAFAEQIVKTASETTKKYAFSMVNDLGERTDYYPIGTPFELEQSAISLARDMGNIPIDLAAEISQEIVKSANDLGVDHHLLPDVVLTLGEPRLLDESWAETQIRLRAPYVPEFIEEAYRDIVKSAADGGNVFELVGLMDNLDQEYIPEEVRTQNFLYRDAWHTLNSGPTVKNADADAEKYVFFDQEDVLIPREAIATISPSKIEQIFSKNTAGEVLEIVKTASDDAFSATALINGLPADIRKEVIRLALKTDVN